MRRIREFALVVLLAAFYLAAVYFAMSALVPSLALRASFFAAMVAVGVYLLLVLIEREEDNVVVALLFLAPVICLAAGVLWWILRLLGLWEPR